MTNKKAFIITGSNAGIGFATALEAAKQNQRVILACRNQAKAESAKQKILEAAPDAEVFIRTLDLSSFDSIRAFAVTIEKDFPQVDVLINNAGIMPLDQQYTKQGFEMQFGVNYLGHFMLTHLLIPLLAKSPEARIINMSSLGQIAGRIRFDLFKGRKFYLLGLPSYAQSKLANVLFSNELAERLPANMTSNAVHPGFVDSEFFRSIPKIIYKVWRHVLVSPEASAKFTVHMALSDEWASKSGEFVSAQGPLPKNRRIKDRQLSERLYYESCKLTDVEPLEIVSNTAVPV